MPNFHVHFKCCTAQETRKSFCLDGADIDHYGDGDDGCEHRGSLWVTADSADSAERLVNDALTETVEKDGIGPLLSVSLDIYDRDLTQYQMAEMRTPTRVENVAFSLTENDPRAYGETTTPQRMSNLARQLLEVMEVAPGQHGQVLDTVTDVLHPVVLVAQTVHALSAGEASCRVEWLLQAAADRLNFNLEISGSTSDPQNWRASVYYGYGRPEPIPTS